MWLVNRLDATLRYRGLGVHARVPPMAPPPKKPIVPPIAAEMAPPVNQGRSLRGRASLVGGFTDAGFDAESCSRETERAPQAMFSNHQFHALHVLSLDGLRSWKRFYRGRCIIQIHKCSVDCLRVCDAHFNLVILVKLLKILPDGGLRRMELPDMLPIAPESPLAPE